MGKALAVDGADPAEWAQNWVAENEDLVIGWLTQ
jgi:ABC-type proline/glycine betaine transport system substrate-binding protein